MATLTEKDYLGCGEWLCPLNRIWERYFYTIFPFWLGVASLLFAIFMKFRLDKKPDGKSTDVAALDTIAAQVRSGANAFLKVEYMFLSAFVFVLSFVFGFPYWFEPVSGVQWVIDKDAEAWDDGFRFGGLCWVGALTSAVACWLGVRLSTDVNRRTAASCSKETLGYAFNVAFVGSSAVGFMVVGLVLFSISACYWLMMHNRSPHLAIQLMIGFGFGTSLSALVVRVAGGIYAKSTDVGADLIGMTEVDISEDDAHNPAVIADKVGDNVGDVAGLIADLLESYVGAIIAAGAIGSTFPGQAAPPHMCLPFWLISLGWACSLVGTLAVSSSEEGKGWDAKAGNLLWGLDKGIYLTAVLFIAFSWGTTVVLFNNDYGWKVYCCIIIGTVTGVCNGKVTEYFTSFDFGPTTSIKDRAYTGPATVVIQGLGVGMISTVAPTCLLVACILACNALVGAYGVAISAVAMLSTMGMNISCDAFGPVADSAGGLARMARMDDAAKAKIDSLHLLGKTKAATGKGFATGSAVITSVSLVIAAKVYVGININFSVSESVLLSGLLFGAMLPYLLSALPMLSVGKIGSEIVEEVKRQLYEVKNSNGTRLKEAIQQSTEFMTLNEEEDVAPETDKCMNIASSQAMKEMLAPVFFAILAPCLCGLLVGPRFLMGALAGAIVSGAMLAFKMTNAGSAWDNSKKLCKKLSIESMKQGQACVVGDAVGDPMKDTSGPCLNIFIKVMSVVSVTIAPFLKDDSSKLTGVGNEDWEHWYWGLIPLILGLLAAVVLMFKQILTWKDTVVKYQEPPLEEVSC